MASTEKELSTLRINAVENETVYQAMVEAGQVVGDELYFVGGTVVGGVTSVNGQTGDVELTASDVSAVSTDDVTQTLGTSTNKVPSEKAVNDAISSYGGKIDTIKVNGTTQTITDKTVDISVPTNNNQLTNGAGYITSSGAPVQSVNNKTGSVSLGASDVGAVPTTRTVNGKALSSNITLSASDVGALPSTTSIPSKTSDLTNDSNFITSAQAPVQSVNNKTGVVTLTASDVGALPDTTVIPTVNDATLDIQQNGASVGKFTANSATDKTVNITVPTKASDIGALPDTTDYVSYTEDSTVEDVDSINADLLQGYNAAYFATASDVSTLSSTVTTMSNTVNTLNTKVTNNSTAIDGMQEDISILQNKVIEKMGINGGTMTGELIAQNNTDYATAQMRNIIISTDEPSGDGNGDIWLRYTE